MQQRVPHQHRGRRQLPQLRISPSHHTRTRICKAESEKRECGFELAP
jgi:hypothetical protein